MNKKMKYFFKKVFFILFLFLYISPFSFILFANERILSLTPSATQMLFAIGADEQIIGVTQFCTKPKEASLKPKIGTGLFPDIETIISFNPTLVIMNKVSDNFIEHKLKSAGIKLVCLEPDGAYNIPKNLITLGKVTAKEENANKLALKIQNEFQIAKNKALALNKKPKVLLVFGNVAAGKGSYCGDIIDLAGGENCVEHSNSKWPLINKELMLVSNPDIIIWLSPVEGSNDDLKTLAQLENDPIWKNCKAVKNKKVFNADMNLFVLPSTDILKALKSLQNIILQK